MLYAIGFYCIFEAAFNNLTLDNSVYILSAQTDYEYSIAKEWVGKRSEQYAMNRLRRNPVTEWTVA